MMKRLFSATRCTFNFLLIGLTLLVSDFSSASGLEGCHRFVSDGGKTFNLKKAYLASDLVVIGKVATSKKLLLKISDVIKGKESAKGVSLNVPHCEGTSCSGGFSVASGIEMLFLLKKLPNGDYDGVTETGNFGCPVVYEIDRDSVKFGTKKVLIKFLRQYFESSPDPILL
jgi:hypothetical protein